jgi:hypothetical protein
MTTADMNRQERGYRDGTKAAKKEFSTSGLYDLRDYANAQLFDRHLDVYYWTGYRNAIFEALADDLYA